jgi:hypothetical protein
VFSNRLKSKSTQDERLSSMQLRVTKMRVTVVTVSFCSYEWRDFRFAHCSWGSESALTIHFSLRDVSRIEAQS